MTMTVLVNAGPWLAVPPPGYGGIENVLAALVPELRRRGVRVVLATVGSSTLPVDEQISTFPDGRFADLQRPYNQVMGVAAAHLHRVVRELRRPRRHRSGARPPGGLRADGALRAGPGLPPGAAHAALGPAQAPGAVRQPRRRRLALGERGVVRPAHHGAPRRCASSASGTCTCPPRWRCGADRRPAVAKGEHLVVVGRVTRYKGQAVGRPDGPRDGRATLVLAGPVGPHHDPADLAGGEAHEDNPDVRYWREEVEPLVDGRRVRWVGTVAGRRATGWWPRRGRRCSPDRLGGARRDRRRRVARAGHPGGGLPAGLPARAGRARPHRAAGRPGRRGRAGGRGRRGGAAGSGRLPPRGRAAVHPGPDGRPVPAPLRQGAAPQRAAAGARARGTARRA